jgi:hypothetical protein
MLWFRFSMLQFGRDAANLTPPRGRKAFRIRISLVHGRSCAAPMAICT